MADTQEEKTTHGRRRSDHSSSSDDPRTMLSTTLVDKSHFRMTYEPVRHDLGDNNAAIPLKNISYTAIAGFCFRHHVPLASIFQAAWAIIVACYSGTEDVRFGNLEGGYGRPSDTLMVDINIAGERTLRQIITEMTESLDDIRKRRRECAVEGAESRSLGRHEDKTSFLSGLQIQRCSYEESETPLKDAEGLDVLAQVFVPADDAVAIKVCTPNLYISAAQASDITCSFAQACSAIFNTMDLDLMTIDNLDIFSPQDWSKVTNWNRSIPRPIDACFHELFREVVQKNPEAPAIHSSDGHDYSYRELDEMSTKLANYLNSGLGIDVLETPIPICFDKSSVAMVSMLGIFKAGCAFVAIDPTYPIDRIRAIIEATGASTVLVDPSYSDLFKSLIPEKGIIALDRNCTALKSRSDEQSSIRVSPSNAAYIHFTSGSTGLPKGIVIEHRQLSTAVNALAAPMRIKSNSRVLQFAAYVFDLSFGDIFVTLSQGGCICVPSEHERINDISGSIVRMRVNVACLVPSIARILRPEEVPGLETLLLGGEALAQDNLERWANRVVLTAMYGPSECTVWCTSMTNLASDSHPNNIGIGYGARLWITSSTNHNRLVPVGSIGELLIEGPVLARGYLNPEQTKQAFIENPEWAMNSTSESRRFYKTGDLVKYNSDGTVTFVGRKDTQIKLYGRRIELGEIEQHLASSSLISQSMVILPSSGIYAKRLVACIVLSAHARPHVKNGARKGEALTIIDDRRFTSELKQIKDHLSLKLPSYMVPSAWLIVQDIPLLISEKMNRVLVKTFVGNLTQEAIERARSRSDEDDSMNNGILNGESEDVQIDNVGEDDNEDDDVLEHRLRNIWSQVLNIGNDQHAPETEISGEKTFAEYGGDSFSAMNLVARCRTEGMVLTVQDVFDDDSSTIQRMANMIKMRRPKLTRKAPKILQWSVRPTWWD